MPAARLTEFRVHQTVRIDGADSIGLEPETKEEILLVHYMLLIFIES